LCCWRSAPDLQQHCSTDFTKYNRVEIGHPTTLAAAVHFFVHPAPRSPTDVRWSLCVDAVLAAKLLQKRFTGHEAERGLAHPAEG
jgi:hypothetical protein